MVFLIGLARSMVCRRLAFGGVGRFPAFGSYDAAPGADVARAAVGVVGYARGAAAARYSAARDAKRSCATVFLRVPAMAGPCVDQSDFCLAGNEHCICGMACSCGL